MRAPKIEQLTTAAKAARALGLHPKVIRCAVRSGELPAYQIRGWWWVSPHDVEAWLERQRYQAALPQVQQP